MVPEVETQDSPASLPNHPELSGDWAGYARDRNPERNVRSDLFFGSDFLQEDPKDKIFGPDLLPTIFAIKKSTQSGFILGGPS